MRLLYVPAPPEPRRIKAHTYANFAQDTCIVEPDDKHGSILALSEERRGLHCAGSNLSSKNTYVGCCSHSAEGQRDPGTHTVALDLSVMGYNYRRDPENMHMYLHFNALPSTTCPILYSVVDARRNSKMRHNHKNKMKPFAARNDTTVFAAIQSKLCREL